MYAAAKSRIPLHIGFYLGAENRVKGLVDLYATLRRLKTLDSASKHPPEDLGKGAFQKPMAKVH